MTARKANPKPSRNSRRRTARWLVDPNRQRRRRRRPIIQPIDTEGRR